ncbi:MULTISPECIES: SCO family protein [Actinomadura]|uniref:SCO family protein n=1 Tax=Actinomadura yumaensis TaxID=111807 RepID=A0ABW2CH08_9ACTN|nr:SCO family protein [Actinomadura sp. J1-007]MWK33208.1 copper chaperone PCu(A)C [Actinomadura sp. J1-007]
MRFSVRPGIVALGLTGVLAGAAACGGSGDGKAAAEQSPPASPYKASMLPASYKIPDVELTGMDGRPYDLPKRTAGRTTLLFFGYTHCPDICPTTMADAAGAMSLLSPEQRAKVQVVFVSADPARDTPKALKDFLGRFDKSFMGLTGPMKTIQRAAADAKVSITPPPENAKGNYLVSHGSNVMVYGPDGSGKLMFPYQFGSAGMAKDLKTLLGARGAAETAQTARPDGSAGSGRPSAPDPGGAAKAGITVSGARVRVPSTPDVTAGYLTIVNNGAPDTLTGITTPAAGSAEMHRMDMNGSSMKMQRMMTVPVPKGTVAFSKGAMHLMLMKPRKLTEGQSVPLKLTFANAGEVTVTAKVVPAGS